MNFPTSALIESVERGLRDKAAKLSRVSNARWVVQFGNGERPPLEVQREDEWLQFTSECNLPTSPNWVGSLWGAVQKNAALPAGIKGAISPARTLELRADLLLSDDTDEESRVRGVVINFEGAWKNDAAMAVARRSENVAELEHLCEEAGWPCVRRSSGRLTVALAVTPVGQATVAFMGDGVRVRVEVADLAAYSSPSRLAVAALALELTSRARLVRASADAESGKLLFEAWWALPPDLAEFDAGLASLSATVRTAGESFAVLQNEQLAKDYLTVRGWTADISHTNQQPERTNR